MVRIKVSRPIAVPDSSKRTVDLKAGVHEVEDEVLEHWFVRGLIKKGVVSVVKKLKDAAPVSKPKTDDVLSHQTTTIGNPGLVDDSLSKVGRVEFREKTPESEPVVIKARRKRT